MIATSYVRGHLVVWGGHCWLYADNGQPADDLRPCPRCGRMPTTEGYDACLGRVEGVVSVCCGHGVHEPIEVRR